MSVCGDQSYSGWITVAAIQNVFLQIFGAIVNLLSLWCLWQCKRTGPAIKLQLTFVFGLSLVISNIALPGVRWINYRSFYCSESDKSVTIFFLLTLGFTEQLERMNISVVAIYRLIAVKFPHLYQRIKKVSVVIIIEVFIFCYISIRYILGFTQTMDIIRYDEGIQYVQFGEQNTTIHKIIYRIYAYNFFLPFLITLVAYSLLIFTVLYRKYKKQDTTSDQLTITLQILVLADLLLDGPHAIGHLAQAGRITMALVHMAFFMHLLVDPLIFLLLNRHNRRALIELLRRTLPARFVAYLPTTESSTAIPSYTPQQNRKYLVNNCNLGNESPVSIRSYSQKFKPIHVTPTVETKTQEAVDQARPASTTSIHDMYDDHLSGKENGIANKSLTSGEDPDKGTSY